MIGAMANFWERAIIFGKPCQCFALKENAICFACQSRENDKNFCLQVTSHDCEFATASAFQILQTFLLFGNREAFLLWPLHSSHKPKSWQTFSRLTLSWHHWVCSNCAQCTDVWFWLLCVGWHFWVSENMESLDNVSCNTRWATVEIFLFTKVEMKTSDCKHNLPTTFWQVELWLVEALLFWSSAFWKTETRFLCVEMLWCPTVCCLCEIKSNEQFPLQWTPMCKQNMFWQNSHLKPFENKTFANALTVLCELCTDESFCSSQQALQNLQWQSKPQGCSEQAPSCEQAKLNLHATGWWHVEVQSQHGVGSFMMKHNHTQVPEHALQLIFVCWGRSWQEFMRVQWVNFHTKASFFWCQALQIEQWFQKWGFAWAWVGVGGNPWELVGIWNVRKRQMPHVPKVIVVKRHLVRPSSNRTRSLENRVPFENSIQGGTALCNVELPSH